MFKLIFYFLAVAILMSACTFVNESGRIYNNLNALKEDQESRGYVVLGKFGDSWPAKVEEIKVKRHEISFLLKSGAKHTYPNYDGYEMKILRLVTRNDREVVIVLRSKDKKHPPTQHSKE